MFSRNDLHNPNLYTFLNEGHMDTTGFDDGLDYEDYWFRISGNDSHATSKSKASDIRRPILRVLQKMIAYSYHHRSTHQDKAYPPDLWLLRLFSEGAPHQYACAPYDLPRHWVRHTNNKIVGGHFVTKIVNRLGVDADQARRYCNHPIPCGVISYGDLRAAKLLKASGIELIDEGEQPPVIGRRRRRAAQPQQPPPQPQHQAESSSSGAFSFESLAQQLGLIQQRFDDFYGHYEGDQRMLHTRFQRIEYEQARYQPYMEEWARQVLPSQYATMPDHHMPDIFIPDHRRGGGFFWPPQEQQQQEDQARREQFVAGTSTQTGGAPAQYGGASTAEPGQSSGDWGSWLGTRPGTYEGGGAPSIFRDDMEL